MTIDIEAIKARAEAATRTDDPFSPAFNEFLRHVRTDVPALVAEVERLRGLIDIVERHTSIAWCPWCSAYETDRHRPDCQAFTESGDLR